MYAVPKEPQLLVPFGEPVLSPDGLAPVGGASSSLLHGMASFMSGNTSAACRAASPAPREVRG